MKRTYKKIISLCAVLVFALALIPTSAFATDPFSAIAVGGLSGASGGGLFSAMAAGSGIDINYGSYPSTDNLDSLWNNLNQDHVYFSGTKGQETIVDPDTGIPTVYDYISVDITDWLQAQSDFIEEFVTTYNVTDNDSGSISEPRQSHGYVFPFSYSGGYYGYAIGNIAYDMTYSLGSYAITFNLVTQGYIQCVITYNGNTYSTSIRDSYLGCPVRFWTNSAVTKVQAIYETSPGAFSWFSAYDGNTTGTGVRTINWYSGTVNTGVYDGYSASKVRIPSSSWSPSDPVNWNVAEFLEELTVKMASGYASDITIENDSPVPPVPPPVPSTPLGDIPTDEWYDLFGLPVLEGQQEIHEDLQDFNDSVSEGLDDIGEQLDDVNDSLGSIDTNIQTGNGLLGDLKTIGQNILSTLNSILSGVTDLVQEIVLSTETFIAGLLNSIMGGLGGWLSTMREAFSIWHYVVEWVGSISTVFSWFWSVAGSTSYYIQLPIYASLAGAVVLAFYKRFGK